jgi:hypothetical protein
MSILRETARGAEGIIRETGKIAGLNLRPFKNPLSSRDEMLLALGAAVVVGGGVWWYVKRGTVVTLSPGLTNQTVKAKAGSTVNLALPKGASWQGVASGGSGGASLAPASGNSNYPVANVTNGEVINATWTDSSGTAQNSTITIQTS